MEEDVAKNLIKNIIDKKLELEKLGKKPRVLLINEDLYNTYLLNYLKRQVFNKTIFITSKDKDNFFSENIFGLWIIPVKTIDDIEVR